MATKFNDFSLLAQAVWAEKTMDTKLPFIYQMIDQCVSSAAKKAGFKRDADLMNCNRLDRFASDLMLRDTDKRIK